MPHDKGALKKRDIFDSPFLRGLSASEQIGLLAERIRFLPTGGLRHCIEEGCEETLTRGGARCETHRNAKLAAAARLRYATKGRKKKISPPASAPTE